MSLGDVAAAQPWPVFACGDDKRPVVATGFKAASLDRLVILEQFDRPGATMIGVPTGERSGLIIIDIDIKEGRDGREWLDRNDDVLPQTRTNKTRSGGLHLVFRKPEGVEIRNSASRIAPGVDVRGEGGYVIIPPSPGYVVADASDPAEMPLWLIHACMKQEAPAPPDRSQERHERYTQAAIDAEVLAVARAGEGIRNDTLNKAAVRLGTLVGAGQMSRAAAESELQRAGQACGLDLREILATIKSGLDFGVRNPREMPKSNGTHHHAAVAAPATEADPNYWQSVEEEQTWQSTQQEADAAIRVPSEDADRKPDPFPATPITKEQLANIPPREMVYGHFLFRKFISALGAPGGAGKTAYAFVVAAAIVTGRDLLGETVHEPGNVWIYNLEDPRTELLRRVNAVLLEHGVTYEQIAGRLFLDSGRDRPLIIAKLDKHAALIAWPQVADLIAEIKARNIRLLIVDPFVRSHRVAENDNDQIDFVAALWAAVADAADCSILLVCHFRKGGLPGEAASFRGAGALIDASRSAVTLAGMSEEEAGKTSIQAKDRWQYVRIDNAKLNLAPPPDSAVWLRLIGIDIGNGAEGRKADSVQTVRRWQPTTPISTLSSIECNKILNDIEAGPEPGMKYTLTKRGGSQRWVGRVLTEKYAMDDLQASTVIASWSKSGLLFEKDFKHPESRQWKPGVYVNGTKRPS